MDGSIRNGKVLVLGQLVARKWVLIFTTLPSLSLLFVIYFLCLLLFSKWDFLYTTIHIYIHACMHILLQCYQMTRSKKMSTLMTRSNFTLYSYEITLFFYAHFLLILIMTWPERNFTPSDLHFTRYNLSILTHHL